MGIEDHPDEVMPGMRHPWDNPKPSTDEVLVEIRDAIRAQTEVNRALLRFLTGVSDPE